MRRVVVVLAAGCLLGVVGCAAGTGGTAAPVSGSSATESAGSSVGGSGLPHSGAPAVADPLPESALAGDPCDAMTRQQTVEALGSGASDGRHGENAAGSFCQWSDPVTGGGFLLGFSTKTREGLSAYYANTKPQRPVFRDAGPIGGFPAVEYKRSEDSIDCAVAVGLADEYALDIVVTLSRRNMGKVDSCEPAKRLASVAVGNLKERAGK
ncbi:Protein of unknown function (DUF3558) [Saccharomonospora marina XMU15]|uniref:DUF3558 domain-containing protein n=1 Tax=Saccharomonospora marina XMU15 TaxID=882083 RepID=H5X174_9PSEU|nr:DUF3558 domain-containing protein [Saccharomonospora marina]EHR48598.1 Protein of unknown function (DUF3558) [Saccharomonospora marina XMU15]